MENMPQTTPPPSPEETKPLKKNTAKVYAGVGILIIALIAVVFSLSRKKDAPGTTNNNTNPGVTKTALAEGFAKYEETPVNIKPKIPAYKANPDLSNVENRFTIPDSAKGQLAKNSFVVTSGQQKEFFQIYETNRYQQLPNFVTTDSLLHNYHIMFDYLLKKTEEEKLSGELKNLSGLMADSSGKQYTEAKGTEWENAAKRNVGFFAVGGKLMDESLQIPETVKTEAEKELALINEHTKIDISPVMNIGQPVDPLENLKEDYSQYIPRGHYDKSELLKAYFKSMMWYGRMTFRFKNDDEIKSAMLITLSLEDQKAATSWNTIYEPTNFFVGKSDDISYYQLRDLLHKVYGDNPSLNALISDTAKFNSFKEQLKNLPKPEINSVPVFNKDIQPDREKEILGFRFMGQRFTVDASIFQRLIDREVPDRMLPKSLDIPAAMGSQEALSILKDSGETKYENYDQNMAKLQQYTKGLPTGTWTQNLYWGWMYSLLSLTEPKGAGYPSFMTNQAWTRKDLNTYLGSWTELKHDTILYAKQSYAEMGGGGDQEKIDDRGYVEPNVYVYARLASIIKMTKEGLQLRGLLTDTNKESLDRLYTIAIKLKEVSEKELNGTTLSDDDYEFIRSYGGQIESIWYDANKDDFGSATRQDYLDENPAALVADVASDPNGEVLEEGTGYINEIYVVVPVDGKLRIAKGGVYSYYEFPWPIQDRLTDKKWRELLKSDKAPKLPEWTKLFYAGQ